jgi:hypothetical protein
MATKNKNFFKPDYETEGSNFSTNLPLNSLKRENLALFERICGLIDLK